MKTRKKIAVRAAQYLFLVLMLLTIVVPLYLLVINSFKTMPELLGDYFGLPSNFYLDNFESVLYKANYFLYLLNSFVVTAASAIGVYLLVPVTSFVIARQMDQHKYFKFLYVFLILGIFVPFQTKMLALVKLMSALQMMNSFGLVLLYVTSSLCTDVFLMVGYLRTIPRDVEEAAIIDGCSRIRSIFSIVYPMAMPMISAIIIKDILWFWNDFLLPLIVVGGKLNAWTLPLFQYNFKSTYAVDYPVAYAAYFMSMLPVLAVYFLASRQITDGLTEGAVKS
ncbi:MAG: carbohydrate ABC transporter permease [Eubacteriales bacterium]|nr:carbohydrate ABC transporter permease [Eubacteriales bacterium]